MNEINHIYRPKEIVVEQQIESNKPDIDNLQGNNKFTHKRLKNQYYTIYKVNEIRKKYEKKHKIKYDYIIQTRPDVLFFSKLNLDKIVNQNS